MAEVMIGVIGCGMISHSYLAAVAGRPGMRIKAVSSRTMVSARARADVYGCEAVTIDALLADPAIAVVVNLAPPETRRDLGERILRAGKHLYSEKPLATTNADAQALLALAAARGLTVGCAPDTFLGDGHQAVRRLVDAGTIGRVVGGAAAMGSAGMEDWHPEPRSFYARGGGPLLDIGPYHVTQLVNLLGAVVAVAALASRPRDQRIVTSPGRDGETIPVEVPTTVNGALLFASGANVGLALSWDVARHGRAALELYGDGGTLVAPDPNGFGGAARVLIGDATDVVGEELPPLPPAVLRGALRRLGQGLDPRTGEAIGPDTIRAMGDLRGLGLIDMVEGLAAHRLPRASGVLAVHVLEVLLALERSAEEGRQITIHSRVERPSPLLENTDLQ